MKRRQRSRPATTSQILDHQLRDGTRSLADSSQPGVPTASTVREQGAAGTPLIGGYIVGEDYNTTLDGINGLKVWDEMRRSSAQVQASLQCIKVPIISAKPIIQPPANGDAQDRSIADACTRMLLGREKDWKAALSHLLLRLDFGSSALEIPWILDPAFKVGDGTQAVVRPSRLAPRLPTTFWRFLPGDSGRLKQLVQYAVKDERWQELTIDAYSDRGIPQLLLTVHQKEGDNWWGRSVLRSAYMHWFYVTQAYRIDGVRLDRYGVGTPMAELAEGHKATAKELDKIEKVLKAMRVNERAWLICPPGVTVKILVPDGGRGGASDLMTSVEHHNAMIARNVLASFLLSESSEHLGSNKTTSLKDFFSSALESVALDLTADLQESVIVPFCDMNFPMRGRDYPTLTVADLNDVDTSELATNLNALSSGDFITADDSIEDILRKVMHLPPLAEEAKGRKRSRVSVPVAGGLPAAGDPGVDTSGDGGTAPAKKKPGSPSPPAAKQAAVRHLAERYTDPMTARVYGREPNAFELATFALREVPDRLDIETHDLTSELAAIRLEQLTSVAETLAKKDARTSTGAFTDLRPDEITMPGLKALEKAIRATQTRVAAYGAFQVRQELQRQGAPIATALRVRESYWTEHYDTHRIALGDPTAGASRKAAKSALISSAKVSAQKQGDAWLSRVLETAVRLRRTGLQNGSLVSGIVDFLKPETTTGVSREARGEVNEAFGIGRATEASAQSDVIKEVVYSSLLDANTCKPCEALDGERMMYGSERYYQTMPPYSGCDGNRGQPDACRCVHLFLF